LSVRFLQEDARLSAAGLLLYTVCFLADSYLLLGTNQFIIIIIIIHSYVAQPVRRLATLWTTGV
jgi:hypothetical protein